MTRQTTSGPRYHSPAPLAFTRDAAEVAAEASEDSLAREVAAMTLHPAPRPRKRLPRAVWAAHGAVTSALTATAFQTGAVIPCAAGGVAYLCGLALVHGREAYGSWRGYFLGTDD